MFFFFLPGICHNVDDIVKKYVHKALWNTAGICLRGSSVYDGVLFTNPLELSHNCRKTVSKNTLRERIQTNQMKTVSFLYKLPTHFDIDIKWTKH